MPCQRKSEIPDKSFLEEGPPTWHWSQVRIPTEKVLNSPTFRYQNTKWLFQCTKARDGFTYLWMHHKGSLHENIAPFAISVWVQGDGSDFNGLSGAVEAQKESNLIWKQETSEVERILPGFSEGRFVHFRIDIKEHDPQTGCNSTNAIAPHCPQFEVHALVADASEQVSLITNSISPLEALSEDFSKMMDADSDLDVELRCQDHSIWAHKSVLCSRSPIFKMMLLSDMVEGRTGVVNIREMDVDTFRQFVRYLYTGRLGEDALTLDSAMCLYEAADMYGVVSLKTFCSDFLKGELTLDNAYDVLAMSDAHADTSFVEMVKSYIVREEALQSTRAIIMQAAGMPSSPAEEKKEAPHTSASKTQLKFKGRTTARPARAAARPYRKVGRPNHATAHLLTRAHYCPQPEKHLHNKTFADASTQTALSASSIRCLETLSEDFSKMMDADSDRDVEIRCQGHSTWAHRSVLCSRSPVFQRMLNSEVEEGSTRVLDIRDIDADIFRQLLMYLYTGKLEALTLDSAMYLYEAARAYQIVSLETLCSDFLSPIVVPFKVSCYVAWKREQLTASQRR